MTGMHATVRDERERAERTGGIYTACTRPLSLSLYLSRARRSRCEIYPTTATARGFVHEESRIMTSAESRIVLAARRRAGTRA